DPSWVLTAAHCLSSSPGSPAPDPDEVYFYVGGDARGSNGNPPTSGSFHQALTFHVHPQYNDNSLDNDIALVRLAQPATGVPAYEPNTAFLNATGQDTFYVGFGATEGVNESGGGVKRSTSVEISEIYQDV